MEKLDIGYATIGTCTVNELNRFRNLKCLTFQEIDLEEDFTFDTLINELNLPNLIQLRFEEPPVSLSQDIIVKFVKKFSKLEFLRRSGKDAMHRDMYKRLVDECRKKNKKKLEVKWLNYYIDPDSESEVNKIADGVNDQKDFVEVFIKNGSSPRGRSGRDWFDLPVTYDKK